MHPASARALVSALLAVTVIAACDAPPVPADAEIYDMVLAAVAKDLELPPPLAIHPLPVQLDRSASGAFLIGALNPHDSASMRAVVKLDPSGYRLCAPAVSGACQTPEGGAAVILSEIQDLKRNGFAIIALVTDARAGRPFQTQYNVRINRGVRGWSVVELRQDRSP